GTQGRRPGGRLWRGGRAQCGGGIGPRRRARSRAGCARASDSGPALHRRISPRDAPRNESRAGDSTGGAALGGGDGGRHRQIRSRDSVLEKLHSARRKRGSRSPAPGENRLSKSGAPGSAAGAQRRGGSAAGDVPQLTLRPVVHHGTCEQSPRRNQGRGVESAQAALATGPRAVLSSAVIRRAAQAAGFDLCGFARAEPIPSEVLESWLAAGMSAEMGWMLCRGGELLAVRRRLPGARAVVALACKYYSPDESAPDSPVARYARGRDYHATLKDRLRALRRALAERHP